TGQLLVPDKAGASETLLRAASAAYPCEDDHPHPIDLPHSSRLYNSCCGAGTAPGWDASTFAQHFMETLGKEVCGNDCNGCFVIAELCEAVKENKMGGRR
ncbi:hypothetical protein C8R45DRAFT_1005275, partial [Mycena sanguinolenta]